MRDVRRGRLSRSRRLPKALSTKGDGPKVPISPSPVAALFRALFEALDIELRELVTNLGCGDLVDVVLRLSRMSLIQIWRKKGPKLGRLPDRTRGFLVFGSVRTACTLSKLSRAGELRATLAGEQEAAAKIWYTLWSIVQPRVRRRAMDFRVADRMDDIEAEVLLAFWSRFWPARCFRRASIMDPVAWLTGTGYKVAADIANRHGREGRLPDDDELAQQSGYELVEWRVLPPELPDTAGDDTPDRLGPFSPDFSFKGCLEFMLWLRKQILLNEGLLLRHGIKTEAAHLIDVMERVLGPKDLYYFALVLKGPILRGWTLAETAQEARITPVALGTGKKRFLDRLRAEGIDTTFLE